jgi:hypothetical protein
MTQLTVGNGPLDGERGPSLHLWAGIQSAFGITEALPVPRPAAQGNHG